jgi:hypothetical protein
MRPAVGDESEGSVPFQRLDVTQNGRNSSPVEEDEVLIRFLILESIW